MLGVSQQLFRNMTAILQACPHQDLASPALQGLGASGPRRLHTLDQLTSHACPE